MPRVNITGGWYSSRNAGDQAILISIHDLLQERVPNLDLEVICAHPEFVRKEYGIRALSQTQNLGKVLLSVARSEALFIGGGTPFYNDFKHMCFFWVLSLLMKITAGKLVVYGASAQHLNQVSARWFARRILNMADLITVREPLTKAQFNALGIRNEIYCTADPAITLTPCSTERTDAIMKDEGLPQGKPYFAICPHFFSNTDPYRVHHYEKFDDTLIERQCTVLARTADYLSEQGTVFFLPMNTDPPDNDVDVQHQIAQHLKYRERIHFIENQYRPREVAGIFSRCKLVVGVRLHSLILSAAVNTPVIGISYAPKVAGFMQLMGEDAHNCPLQQLQFSALRSILDAYLVDYENRRKTFCEHVQQVKDEAAHNADMAATLLTT